MSLDHGGEIEELVVRCFAVPHKDGVIARCIDLDLAVIRPTLAEARRELEHQISGYVKAVATRGWPIRRPASASVYALYLTVVALHRFWLLSDRIRKTSVWQEPASLATAA
jgi:hypothetical protein